MAIDLITTSIYLALNLKKIVRIELFIVRFNCNKKNQSVNMQLKNILFTRDSLENYRHFHKMKYLTFIIVFGLYIKEI